jgi:signal peptidase I
MGKKWKKFEDFLYRETVLFFLIIAIIIFASLARIYALQAFYVPSASMMPTLKPWDRVLANKFVYNFIRPPERGDIIVFKAPKNFEDLIFTKRVIAKGGEEVKIREGIVYINNELLEDSCKTLGIPEDYGPVKVPEGTLFVLGDYRDYSNDSRDWGPVPEEDVIGKVFFVYFPYKRMGKIK